MCDQIKTLTKNHNGQLSFCSHCNVFHLTFNNIYIEFSNSELNYFQEFIENIEIEYWENKYETMVLKRKIPIQTMQQNLSLMFNKQELESLKNLVVQTKNNISRNLSVLDIDYTLFLN